MNAQTHESVKFKCQLFILMDLWCNWVAFELCCGFQGLKGWEQCYIWKTWATVNVWVDSDEARFLIYCFTKGLELKWPEWHCSMWLRVAICISKLNSFWIKAQYRQHVEMMWAMIMFSYSHFLQQATWLSVIKMYIDVYNRIIIFFNHIYS